MQSTKERLFTWPRTPALKLEITARLNGGDLRLNLKAYDRPRRVCLNSFLFLRLIYLQ